MTERRHHERLMFDKVPEIYDRVRPSYPPALFDEAFRYLRERVDVVEPRVVEIGPGTGQATQSMLECGARVTAVEIGASLSAFLRRKFAGESRLEVTNASFEVARLESGAYDLVLAATAFHWIDPAIRYTKTHDLLRAGGALAIVTTNQIASETDRGFFARVQPVYQKYFPDEDSPALPGEDVVPDEFDEMRSSGLFGDVTLQRCRWDQTYTTETYADQMRSYSGMQAMLDQKREALIEEVCKVVEGEFGGSITRPVVMTLTIGRRA